MQRESYIQSIENKLSLLVTRVKLRGRLNLQDLNIHSENFFRDLLNIIYDYDLKNLNNFKSNAEGVDLIDSTNKVIVQVTSTATTTKINSSIRKLTKFYQGYNLKFIIIIDQIPKLFSKVKPTKNEYISFNPKSDIIDIGSILKEISDCDINKLEKIYNFFKNEIYLEEMKGYNLSRKVDFRKQMLSKAQWNHETTNDNRYVKRSELAEWLTSAVNNTKVRTISIRGMGGTGKTSLIGHWAKIDKSEVHRTLEGLFYWSFYVERDCNKFIESLLEYFEKKFNFDFEENEEYFSSIDFFIQSFYLFPPILVVIDGIEVLQEGMNESNYGTFIDSILRDFILQITSAPKPWLCITTSRFPLIDVRSKREFKEKQIFGVNNSEGALILANHGINGSIEEREFISKYLEGHPLGLKVFAASFESNNNKNQPLDHFGILFSGLSSNEISDKLDKLLWFYKKNASELHTQSLSALSMFRKSISVVAWVDICRQLISSFQTTNYDIKVAIAELVQIGLVIKDSIECKEMYSCHPVIRDFFNNSYLVDEPESGKLVARFLTQSPDSIEISGVASIERFIVSIEALLKTNHEVEAIDIYLQRLKKGQLFLKLGTPKEARRLYRLFIDYYILEGRKQTRVGDYRKGYLDIINDFIHPYIEYCIQLGDFREAESAIEIAEKYRVSPVCFRWRAVIKLQQGKFQEAIALCKKAIEMDRIELLKKQGKIESTIISSFLLFEIYIIIGEDSKSLQSKMNELIKLSSLKKFSYFSIRALLSSLIYATYRKDKTKIIYYIEKVEEEFSLVQESYFKLQIQIVLAQAYILINDLKNALLQVEVVYRKSVQESYPYILYLSSLLKAKIKYLIQDSSFNIDSVINTYEQSISNGMPLISLKAIDLILEIKGNSEEFEELRDYYRGILGLI